MKKVLSILIIVLIFFVGIKIGSNNSNSSSTYLFDNAKEEFENEIVIPNNKYQNIDLKPKEYLPNKVAKIICNLIEKITNKLA